MCRFLSAYLVVLSQEQRGRWVLGTRRQQMSVLSPAFLAFGGFLLCTSGGTLGWDPGGTVVALWIARYS